MQDTADTSVSVDTLIDGFVANTRLTIGLEVPGDLLGAPQLTELGFGKDPYLPANRRSSRLIVEGGRFMVRAMSLCLCPALRRMAIWYRSS